LTRIGGVLSNNTYSYSGEAREETFIDQRFIPCRDGAPWSDPASGYDAAYTAAGSEQPRFAASNITADPNGPRTDAAKAATFGGVRK
jgi:hypothetical protein